MTNPNPKASLVRAYMGEKTYDRWIESGRLPSDLVTDIAYALVQMAARPASPVTIAAVADCLGVRPTIRDVLGFGGIPGFAPVTPAVVTPERLTRLEQGDEALVDQALAEINKALLAAPDPVSGQWINIGLPPNPLRIRQRVTELLGEAGWKVGGWNGGVLRMTPKSAPASDSPA